MKLDIDKSIEILNSGGVILYPTDTIWGLGCDATNFDAVSKIYQLKNRVESKSLIVLVSSFNMLKKHVSVSKKAIEIIKKNEKPTTIIYKNPKGFSKNLIAEDKTVAIRIVQDEFCRKLIKRFGKPIVSTSANVSNKPTPKSFKEISQEVIKGVDYIVNLHHEKICDKPSSIIKLSNSGIIKIIRT